MGSTYSNENCSARCHQACNGVSIGQTRYAKDSGHSIIWKYLKHGSGIAEVIVPPAAVYKQPNWPSAVEKSCSVCRNPIRTRFADLAYHCANPSCGNVSHLAAACAGFVYLDNALFLQEFGTVISTLHHQQLQILHYHLTTCLLVLLHSH